MTTQTQLKTAKKEVEKVLRKYEINPKDMLVWYQPAQKQKVDIKAWERAAGIWKNRRMPDPIKWQRKIRKKWERKLP